MIKLRKILSILFLTLSSLAFAQKDELMIMAIDHFGAENQTSAWWLKDFSGYLDYAHEVRMVIATNNDIYKGAYELKSSGLRFFIDGQLEGNEIHFVETDLFGRITGYISGELNEDKFYCTWSDAKNIEQMNLNLYEVKNKNITDNNLGWIEYYKVVNKDSNLKSFTLKNKEGNFTLTYAENSYIMECNDEVCSTLSSISNIDEKSDEVLFDRLHKTVTLNKESNNKIHLSIENKILFNTNSFMDFDERVSVTYPKSDNVKFTNWSNTFFTSMFNKETFEHVKKTNNDALSERCKNVYMGDINIDFASDSIVSGVFVIQSSASPKVTEISFCYDLKKNKKVEIEEIFLLNEDFKTLVNSKAKQLEANEISKNKDFSIFTLSENGIKCRTPFSTIYGREEFLISYAELKPFILKKGILARYGNK